MWVTLLTVTVLVFKADCCGIITHTEIGLRALHFLGNSEYKQLILEHQDAYQGGNAFPDTFYNILCDFGKLHNVSEKTHWTPFLKTSINYIRQKYKKPWDEGTKKLVVFLLGIATHQIADVVWHSLDIRQGFIDTMRWLDFQGNYTEAHGVADTGGDIINLHQLKMNDKSYFREWYIPIDDLYNIYYSLYGKEKVSRRVIHSCTSLLLLGRELERKAGAEVYPVYAGKSPFLLTHLKDYFYGGMTDMAAWSVTLIEQVAYMLDHGVSVCDLPKNPLFISCNGSGTEGHDIEPNQYIPQYFINPATYSMSLDDVEVTPAGRGIVIRVKQDLMEPSFQPDDREHETPDNSTETLPPNLVLTSTQDYEQLGQSLATGSVTGNGSRDLIIGAPGDGLPGYPSCGRVYIIKDPSKSRSIQVDINERADYILETPKSGSQFGWSVAAADVDCDGQDDVIVGAPRLGAASRQYTGAVYVYFGPVKGNKYQNRRPDVSILCSLKTCGLGWTLSNADLNGDGCTDVAIGSPYAGLGHNNETGTVSILLGSRDLRKHAVINQSDLTSISGCQNYSWFGYSVSAQSLEGAGVIAVGSPGQRKCLNANCSKNVPELGRVAVYHFSNNSFKEIHVMQGDRRFGMMGFSTALMKNGKNSVTMATGASGKDVSGKIRDVPVTFQQAGSVHLLHIDKYFALDKFLNMELSGNQYYGHFGSSLQFVQSADGPAYLMVGADTYSPNDTPSIHRGDQGIVYIFDPKSVTDCGLFEVTPCPMKQAKWVLDLGEEKSRFGTSMAVYSNDSQVVMAVSAVHSSRKSRMGGAVAVFIMPKGPRT